MAIVTLPAAFTDVTVILPVVTETDSLRETVDILTRRADDAIREFLIVVCDRTTPESLETIDALAARLGERMVVHHQVLPYLGGAMREAFDLARGSHVIMMASDLETDPALVPDMIEQSRQRPDAVITATRWRRGGRFKDYAPVKLVLNWVFQQFFRILFATRLTDLTYGYRLFPTSLVTSIRWDELKHPLLFETILKPLRLGVPVIELPTVWTARDEGESQNQFSSYFRYLWIGMKYRFVPRRQLLRAVPAEQ